MGTSGDAAALLHEQGVRPEDVVAVAAVHDVELPARLLGVRKAGRRSCCSNRSCR